MIALRKAPQIHRKKGDFHFEWLEDFDRDLWRVTQDRVRAEKLETMIEEAVWGMLPKNRLGRKMLKKLKVYRGTNHPHQAQKPERIEVAE